MYLINNQILFTKSDSIILFLLGTSIIFSSISLIYLSIRLNKAILLLKDTINLVKELQDSLEDMEDNNININRTTQLMIMDFSRKLGVDISEKRL